jgi:PAS domain S-box-containing protein
MNLVTIIPVSIPGNAARSAVKEEGKPDEEAEAEGRSTTHFVGFQMDLAQHRDNRRIHRNFPAHPDAREGASPFPAPPAKPESLGRASTTAVQPAPASKNQPSRPPEPMARTSGGTPPSASSSSIMLHASSAMGSLVPSPPLHGELGRRTSAAQALAAQPASPSPVGMVLDSPDFMHILSSRGIVLYMSASSRHALGYEPREVEGRSISHLCHPADLTAVLRELKSAVAETAISLVYRLRRRAGDYVWANLRGHRYEMPNCKRTKAFVLSGRCHHLGTLPVSAVAPVLQPEAGLWGKLSASGGAGLFLHLSPLQGPSLSITTTNTTADTRLARVAERCVLGGSLLDLLPGGEEGTAKGEEREALARFLLQACQVPGHARTSLWVTADLELVLDVFNAQASEPHLHFQLSLPTAEAGMGMEASPLPAIPQQQEGAEGEEEAADLLEPLLHRPTNLQLVVNALRAANAQLERELAEGEEE